MSEEEYYEIYGDDDEDDMSYEEYLERTRPPYDLYLTRKQIVQTVICERIAALKTEKLTIDLIQYVIKNCYDENILNQLLKNMPKTQEVFDFFEQYMGREEAIKYVNPNFVSIEEVENLLEKLKNTSREDFERILLNLEKQNQTEKMYNMFAEIAEPTIDPTGYRCLAHISPDICTPELWEKFYARADRIWVCVPEELQTEEKRTQVFDRIVNAIEKMPDKDKQIECGAYLQTIMQEEDKNYTSSGRFIGRELADDYQKFAELITRITENSNENQEKNNFVLQSISNVRTDEINTVISAVAPAEQTKKDPTRKGDNTIDE